MKKYIVLMIFISVALKGVSQYYFTDTLWTSNLKFNGDVYSVVEKFYEVSVVSGKVTPQKVVIDGKFAIDKVRHSETNRLYYFDEKGRVNKIYKFSPTTLKIIYYGNNDRIDSIIGCTFFSDDTIVFKTIANYNNNTNQLIEILTYSRGQKISRNGHYYDRNGNLMLHVENNYTGSRETKKEIFNYEYQNGKLMYRKKEIVPATISDKEIEELTYNTNGQLIFEYNDYGTGYSKIHTKYMYDSVGRIVKKERNFYLSNEALIDSFTYRHYEDDKVVVKEKITRDEKGTMVELITDSIAYNDYYKFDVVYDNDETVKKKFVYKNGYCTEYIDGKNKYVYEYKYDMNNNWIEVIEYKNGVPIFLKERTFKYR